MTIGKSSCLVKKSRGFSYIELLISLLILSSGLWCFVELTLRTQFAQIASTQQFKEILIVDYMATQLSIRGGSCVRSHQGSGCGLVPINQLVGVFDKTSGLLEGYALADSNPVGCINAAPVANSFLLGVYDLDTDMASSIAGLCKNSSASLQLEARLTLL